MANEHYSKHVAENDGSRTLIEWSEFHYHFFSFLIDKETPRDLAMGVELQIFPRSFMPNVVLLETYLNAFIDTDDPTEALEKVREIYNANLLPNQEAFNG